jgi:hypothetical protein
VSQESAVSNGQPVTYWMFRNLVSVTQILVTVAVVAGCVVWALTDDNGLVVWAAYSAFSTSVSQWSQSLSLPWG